MVRLLTFPVAIAMLMWGSLTALAAAVSSPQAGTNLPQVHDSIGGVALAQAFASLDILGQWLLPSGPRLQVMSFMTKNGGECTEADQNPDNCPHYALLVSLFDWPSSLIDPALYRGPERLAWKMMSDRPKKLRDMKDGSEYSLDILACETSPYIENGNREYDWHGVRYEMDIGVSLLPGKKNRLRALELCGEARPLSGRWDAAHLRRNTGNAVTKAEAICT